MEKNLNMPKTEFSQRSNSEQTEPMMLSLWERLEVFKERNALNKNGTFLLHDGPPYANGDCHAGHGLNKVLKDVVVKYNLMSGKKVDFRPGFDCHGLPTELAVLKKFGTNLSTKELRDKCKDWAFEHSSKQKESFKSLGLFADWENSYYTMSKKFESKQLELFYSLLNKKLVYLESRPVYYSPSSRTVLAESELEYKMRKDRSAYFKLQLDDNKHLLVWTTQPWTVLGNVAVCVNPELTYKSVDFNGSVYVVENSFELDGEVLSTFKGSELDGVEYLNKLTNKTGVVVCDSFVESGSGTGLVHLCPSHGEDDFDVCLKYNLETNNDLTDSAGNLLLNGLFCLNEGNESILKELELANMLFKSEEYEHSYPHDWRTNKPVYFKLTKQFFLDLERVREDAKLCLKGVDMSDDRWLNRLSNMLNLRQRWCLSRQRKWGFPLATFLKDGELYMNQELNDWVLNRFKKEGSDFWFDLHVSDLPMQFKHLGLQKCDYTMDVWFDSGSSWYTVLDNQVADLYLEGSDQCRGWYQSSLLTSVMFDNKAPYKKVLTHGFVLDDKGNKMAKSVGNVVSPRDVQKKYNTDVFRLWVFTSNYKDDVQLGDQSLKTCADYYFKLRNTLKYLLGNMYGYVETTLELRDKDKLALDLNNKMYKECLENYSLYNFRKVSDTLMPWLAKFSGDYLDVETKSYLYEYDVDSLERLRCQYVMKDALEKMLKVLAPVTPFLAEDAYQNYEFKKHSSVYFEEL